MDRQELVAQRNMFWLNENPYPGRGIVMGMDGTGKYAVQVYWIMGRNENSRNRVLTSEDGRLFTVAADPAKVKDPHLIIYNAMRERDRKLFVVSNGEQTEKVVVGGMEALSGYQYEPDAPNFTPRITGMCFMDKGGCPPFFTLAILRKSLWDDTCDRNYFSYQHIGNGFGFCITTYSGDGDPLPAFKGEPLIMPLMGDIDNITDAYWNALDEKNRVSLAVKFIPVDIGQSSAIWIKNKYTKV